MVFNTNTALLYFNFRLILQSRNTTTSSPYHHPTLSLSELREYQVQILGGMAEIIITTKTKLKA